MERRRLRKIDIVFSRFSGATEITIRDCDSLKSISSVDGRRVACTAAGTAAATVFKIDIRA